jgi:hypothetical protein
VLVEVPMDRTQVHLTASRTDQVEVASYRYREVSEKATSISISVDFSLRIRIADLLDDIHDRVPV